ncbi:MAG TPA: PilN domain-containing protein, partial [Candidatus Omnitrophota bacterium]|nr:PilN domain-containing protein [Candidatus Omnitrophota bacterium]
ARKGRGKCRVVLCEASPLADGSDQASFEALTNLLARLSVIPDKPVILLPRRIAILRQMQLPSQDPAEIHDMIGLRLIHDIPYAVEEVMYRHYVLDRDGYGYSLVLVVIVCKEKIRRYEEILHQTGIADGAFVLDSFGILGWANYQEELCKIHADRAIALLSIDAIDSQICFCAGGKLFFSRILPHKNVSSAPVDKSELMKEIRASLELYRRECRGPEIGKIGILPCKGAPGSLDEDIKNQVRISAEVLESLENVPRVENSIINREYPFSITAGIGALVSRSDDLLSWRVNAHSSKQPRRIWKLRMTAAILLLLIMLLGLFGRLRSVHRNQEYLRSLRTYADRAQTESQRAQEKVRFFRSFDGKPEEIFLPDLLDKLILAIPAEVALRTFDLDQEGNLSLQGYALTPGGIIVLQEGLKSAQFHNVDLRSSANRQIAGRSVIDFRIDFQLMPGQEMGP